MRPADVQRLLVVLAEVAGRVEELLGDDRRAQGDVAERERLAGGGGRSAELEVHAEGRDIQFLDDAVGELSYPAATAAVERDELHRLLPSSERATIFAQI